jgi:glycosyltransferase involved in cell wall biosynthesis
MIVVYHNENKVVAVANTNAFSLEKHNYLSLPAFLLLLAKEYPKELLIWCHESLKGYLNMDEIASLFHHKKLLLSYNPSSTNFIDKSIGYIDGSLFIGVKAAVPFASWQMSSCVGGVSSEVLLALPNEFPLDTNFDYFLCSLTKLMMPKGLLCYSEPRLLKPKVEAMPTQSSSFILFRFVRQHYRTRWIFLLLLHLVLYERKFPILPFLFSFFYQNRTKIKIDLEDIKVQSDRKVVHQGTVDVIIPTIGRKDYLYEVLMDLKNQTHLPTNVLIVEQNPDDGSVSELDYLTNEAWPFAIKHSFTHQAGACNARNVAMKQITSEWVFFADDDIRIEADFVQKGLKQIIAFGVSAVSFRCFQNGQKPTYTSVFQWVTFGSGCSLVLAEIIQHCHFKMGYEFGFGEDGDFGMQLRKQGQDVLFLPEPEILHLKAPMGGFRTKPVLQWQGDSIQPKPSPTIMLFQLMHTTKEQIIGYKTILFFKYYRIQTIKSPILYYRHFKKQWERSVFWANELKKQNEI